MLFSFIAGMIFCACVWPILESISAVIMTGLEVIKSRWSIIIAKNNMIIQNGGEEDIPSRPIGFTLPQENKGEPG